MYKNFLFFLLISAFLPVNTYAQHVLTGDQIVVDYNNPREFEIGGISVSGTEYIEDNVVIMVTRLNVGQKIMVPGEDISNAISNLWRQDLFRDVSIGITSIQDNIIFLDIELKERPRLTRYEFIGARRSDADNLEEKLNLTRGDVVTESLLFRA